MKGFWFKSILILLNFVLVSINQTYGQKVLLSANGPGNTYEEINKKFAPGKDVIEVPDCVHSEFGRHINEIYDEELEKHVFNFRINIEGKRTNSVQSFSIMQQISDAGCVLE